MCKHSTPSRTRLLPLLLPLLVTGCSGHRHDFATREPVGIARYLAMQGSSNLQERTEGPPEIPRPARLVAYEIVRDHPDRPAPEGPFESAAPRPNRHLGPFLESLSKRRDRFAFATALTPLLLRGPPTIVGLREAALQAQADLLLVTDFDYRTRTIPTAWAFFNVTGIGLFLVPSERCEVTLRLSVLLLEPRSGYVLDATVIERVEHTMTPTFLVPRAERRTLECLAETVYGALESRLIQAGQ